MNTSVYINKLATFLPNAPVSNEEMEGILGLIGGKPSRARKIVLKSNGIKNRHYALCRESGKLLFTNAQMTAEAVRRLASIEAPLDNIDLLCCGTSTPDQLIPSQASMVHGELKNPTCEIAGFSGVCLAGVISLKYAYMSVLSGLKQCAVATGSELLSTFMHAKNFQAESESAIEDLERRPEIAFEKDFLRWMLSDGAAAAMLSDKPNQNALSLRIDWIDMHSYAHELPACMYAGAIKEDNGRLRGWREFDSFQELADNSVFAFKQDVKLLNEHVAPYTLARGLSDTLKKRKLDPADVDWFLPHYSSNYFRDKAYDSMLSIGFDIPQDRWFTNLERVGNIGSASMYFMLNELYASGMLKQGNVLLCYVPESGRFATGFIKLTVVSPQ